VPAGTRRIKKDKIDSHSPIRSRTGFMGMTESKGITNKFKIILKLQFPKNYFSKRGNYTIILI